MKSRFLFFALFVGLSLLVSGLHAQYVLVDFMYVPEGGNETYVKMEQSYAKPVHQKLIDEDKLNYWGLFRVAYPAGTGAKYHYVTVRIYEGADQLASSTAFTETFEELYQNEILEALMGTVTNTRDLIETHRLDQWASFMNPDLEEHPQIYEVNYLKIDRSRWDAYQKMESTLFYPMHKKEVEMDYQAGWQALQLKSPMGSSMPYSHVAVNVYKDWGQYMKPKDRSAIQTAVHPKKTLSEMDAMYNQTTDLVRTEEWHLIDFVRKENE